MYTHLMFERMGAYIITFAELPIFFEHEFWHEEERDALGAGRRIGQARQHEMDDVVGEIVLAIGDEDLLPEQTIAAVGMCARHAPAGRRHPSRPAAR